MQVSLRQSKGMALENCLEQIFGRPALGRRQSGQYGRSPFSVRCGGGIQYHAASNRVQRRVGAHDEPVASGTHQRLFGAELYVRSGTAFNLGPFVQQPNTTENFRSAEVKPNPIPIPERRPAGKQIQDSVERQGRGERMGSGELRAAREFVDLDVVEVDGHSRPRHGFRYLLIVHLKAAHARGGLLRADLDKIPDMQRA